MTKRANSSPPGDKPVATAPPPPPSWRNWLWAIAFALFFLLFFVLPGTQLSSPVTLTYSQFTKDVAAKQVETVTISSDGSASGTFRNGHGFTTVVPVELAGPSLLTELQKDGV